MRCTVRNVSPEGAAIDVDNPAFVPARFRLVMDNGEWLDKSKYDVLNRGWEAVPKAERPDYWKNYYDPKPGQP